jgi:kynurenine formamidase
MWARRLAVPVLAAALAVASYGLGVASGQGGDGVARADHVANAAQERTDLWNAWDDIFKDARFISLSHVIAPKIPVWKGFGPSQFSETTNPDTGQPYTYEKDGFVATSYRLATDQLGSQLDPPAHWDANRAAIDELPPTFALRQLVVISIVDQVKREADYHLQVSDIRAFERENGRIPEGSVVMVRSDWSKDWPDPELAQRTEFPGVSLDALKFLHLKRHILFHGHEPLDTDTTPTLEGEAWLMHHGYTQGEGVANLDRVPETGCLLATGFPRFKGGVGGYASYTAICPPGTRRGTKPSRKDAPLKRIATPLHFDAQLGYRTR